MAYHTFFWTEKIVEHLADNDVTKEEFERIVSYPESTGFSHSSGRPSAFGYANDGRFLICIFEHLDETQILPVTAYQIGE